METGPRTFICSHPSASARDPQGVAALICIGANLSNRLHAAVTGTGKGHWGLESACAQRNAVCFTWRSTRWIWFLLLRLRRDRVSHNYLAAFAVESEDDGCWPLNVVLSQAVDTGAIMIGDIDNM